LKTEDIDFGHGTVTIEHLKARTKLSCPKCGTKVDKAVAQEQQHRRIRTLPLDSGTLEMLRTYIKRGGPVKHGEKRLPFGINRRRAWQIVKECAERAGLPKLVNPETGKVHNVSPHKLRDAFAVHAVKLDDSGDRLRLLREQLGHVSFNTTAKYRKVAGEESKDWYDKLWKDEVKRDGA
jgi:integrase/recombinase XerD